MTVPTKRTRSYSASRESQASAWITVQRDVLVDRHEEHAERLPSLGEIVREAAGDARQTVDQVATSLFELTLKGRLVHRDDPCSGVGHRAAAACGGSRD